MSFRHSIGLWRGTTGSGLFCAVIVVLTLVARVHADSWWINSKNDTVWTNKPLRELKSLAESSDAAGAYYYARALYFGDGVDCNWRESFRWTVRAAERGYADAQYMAAHFYFNGMVSGRDPEEALAWASRAAAKGHADALGLVADAHAYGNGTNQNPTQALKLYHEAIQKGSVLALNWLGYFYVSGEGGTAERTNFVEALHYFQRAASNNIADAALYVVEMCEQGAGTPPDAERALYWARYFADRNDPDLQKKLAFLYDHGMAEPRNYDDRPTEILRRAAEKRAASLQRLVRQNLSVPNLQLLVNDINDLAERYFFGLGTARDYVASARWLWQAAQLSGLSAVMAGGQQAESPHVFDAIVAGKLSATSAEKRRLHQAVDLVHRGLGQNAPDAVRTVGEMYRDGSELTPQSPLNAWIWLNRAAELGNGSAKTALAEVEKVLSPEQLASAKARFFPKAIKN